jgi:hypothetical protein
MSDDLVPRRVDPGLPPRVAFCADALPRPAYLLGIGGCLTVSPPSTTASQISVPRVSRDWSGAAWTSWQAPDECDDQTPAHGCDEFGIWRSGRNGGSSGSVTFGNGKLRDERGAGRS